MKYYKVYNPDIVEIKQNIQLSSKSVLVRILPKEFGVFEENLAIQLQSIFSSLEVVEATEKEYADYRKFIAKKLADELKLAEEAKKAKLEIQKAEKKRTDRILAKRADAEKEALKDAEKHKEEAINKELEAIEKLGGVKPKYESEAKSKKVVTKKKGKK